MTIHPIRSFARMTAHRADHPTIAPSRRGGAWPRAARGRLGVTLVELLVVVTIVSILLGLAGFAFRDVRKRSHVAHARNAILAYLSIARNYSVANRIETMLVINPYNGLFELWHLNPPAQGGPWDPLSGGTAPPLTDGYAFARVLDGGARLPVDSQGRPTAVVSPIDFTEPARSHADNEANRDNLSWVAFCFDEHGKLVTRTRRIATRSFRYRDGDFRPANQRNRTYDEKPDLTLLQSVGRLVDVNDTPITSTLGFIVSDRASMERFIGRDPTPSQLADGNNGWLALVRPGRRYSKFAETVAIDRNSGQQVAGGR